MTNLIRGYFYRTMDDLSTGDRVRFWVDGNDEGMAAKTRSDDDLTDYKGFPPPVAGVLEFYGQAKAGALLLPTMWDGVPYIICSHDANHVPVNMTKEEWQECLTSFIKPRKQK